MRRYNALLMALVVVTSGMLVGMAGGVGASTQPYDTDSENDYEGDAMVTFEAQTSGGTTVTVDEAHLPEGGFVTIHDSSLEDGEVFGSVVGTSTFLEPGTHEDIEVHLEKPLSEDDTLLAMPHMDTDGDQIYSFVSSNGEEDGPYTVDGDIVMDDADVTVSAAVEMADQPTDGESVVIDRVELAEGGFVTVHDSTLTDGQVFESVRGTSEYLEAGIYENVRVTLDDTLEDDETLFAMPHMDTNDNEEYDFLETDGAEDGPYADANGDPVMVPAEAVGSDESTVSFEAQPSGGNAVVVEDVYLPDGGFVTMHDSTIQDGQVFESIRGTSEYLEPGLHHDVVVHLDETLEDDDTLFAMPHMDTNDNEEYDFPNSEGKEDGPYTVNGDIVMDDGDVEVSAAVWASAQESDGNTVVIDMVDTSEGGFVTIHDSSMFAGDVFGSVVGTSEYLEPGVHEGVEVQIDDRLTTSQTIVPMAHMDTNDNQEYDFAETEGEKDGPYVADGNAVVDTATVIVPASVGIDDQESDGHSVVVDDVTLHDGGFVTIHDSTLTDGAVFDSVRGTSEYLEPGTHENVAITLDDELSADETVFAMPHLDTNDNQEYDFLESEGAEDSPYAATGEPIMTAASIVVDHDDDEMSDDDNMDNDSMDDDSMGDNNGMGDDETDQDVDDSDGLPGFGMFIALIALFATAGVARLYRNE